MMMAILALSTLGSWTYTGFLGEPAPVANLAANSPQVVPEKEEKPATVPRLEAPRLPAPKPEPAPRPPTARPTLYRTTDATGQSWEHPDPAYLASYIGARNRSLANLQRAPTPQPRSSGCPNGRCY